MAFLLKVLEPSEIVSPAGNQVSIHRSKTFHIQTTTDLFFRSLQIQRFSSYLNNSRQESCGCHHTQGSVVVFVEGRERKVILDESSHDQVAIVEWSLFQNVDHQSTHEEEGACEGSVGNRLQAQKKTESLLLLLLNKSSLRSRRKQGRELGLHRFGGSGVSSLCNMGIEAGIQAQAGWKFLSGLATVPAPRDKLKRMAPGMVAYTLNLRTSELCWNCKDYGERLRERLMYFAL